jgi:AbrB family looped-hinge helix DNA binding protein
MLTQLAKVDQTGRITLPKEALDTLGLTSEAEVIIETTNTEVVIRPQHPMQSITERIAQMNLPVADWQQMEEEIESGRRAS